MLNRPLLVAIGATALVLAAAPAAHARIVLNKSIAGIRLGMSSQRVLAVLGDPNRQFTGGEGITTFVYRHHALRVLLVEEQGGFHDVYSVQTTSRKERTRSGVGVGTNESTLRRRLHGERCQRVSIGRFCFVGGKNPGISAETDFKIGRNHRVTKVEIFASDF